MHQWSGFPAQTFKVIRKSMDIAAMPARRCDVLTPMAIGQPRDRLNQNAKCRRTCPTGEQDPKDSELDHKVREFVGDMIREITRTKQCSLSSPATGSSNPHLLNPLALCVYPRVCMYSSSGYCC